MDKHRSVMDFSREDDLFRARLKKECCRIAALRARELSEEELCLIAAAGDPATQANQLNKPENPES